MKFLDNIKKKAAAFKAKINSGKAGAQAPGADSKAQAAPEEPAPKPENLSFKEDFKWRISQVRTTRWVRFAIVSILFFLFVIWIANPWLLLIWFLLVDIYITQYVPWGWWKKKKGPVRTVMAWVDAIVYALILVYIIFAFIGQNYKIPSSSLEKSLLVGDYLWVNKMVYGPRVPNTPLHFPLADHTMPLIGGKSYIDNPQLPYHRLPGLRWVERGDIVVFNYPEGDTLFANPNHNYYIESYAFRQETGQDPIPFFEANKAAYGDIIVRPVDRRDAYVKRAVGLPGEWLRIVNDTIYVNGKPLGFPPNVQFNYIVPVNRQIPSERWLAIGVRQEDYTRGFSPQGQPYYPEPHYLIPLTSDMKKEMQGWPEVAGPILRMSEADITPNSEVLWPLGAGLGWTISNTDEFWIPKRGKTLQLTLENLPLYRRAIETYEHNTIEVKPDGTILINGKDNPYYTFKYDYFWMMGDNRDNSADSRFFGLVPEDHIIGMPMRILISIDEDRGLFDLNKIRWNRILSNPNPDKQSL